MAPGANLIFFDKSRNQESNVNSAVKELEMINFDDYQKSCQQISQYILRQVS